MNAQTLLDQLLRSGRELAEQGRQLAGRGERALEERLGVPAEGPERQAMLDGMKKGALAAGALALLLGTRAGRRLGGTALRLGSLAAVGGLAWKAFQDWQRGQGGAAPPAGTPVHRLAGPASERRSRQLLRAMIAAAKADGHIDADELTRIREQIDRLGLGSELARFMRDEVARPLDVRAVAEGVDDPESAAEVYLASLLVIDTRNEQERQYLDRLADALHLPPALREQLERQVAEGAG